MENGLQFSNTRVDPHNLTGSLRAALGKTQGCAGHVGQDCRTPHYSATQTKTINIALTQLAADILSIISQGEKSAEIIRKVLFELADFNAYHLFQEIRNGSRSYLHRSRALGHDGNYYEYPMHPGGEDFGAEQNLGIDDRAIFCYFRTILQPGTLKSELTDRQCTFLVNLMTDNNKNSVNYEQFLDFIIPRTKKKITNKLISKIKQTQPPLVNGMTKKCKYDAVCTLAKLFECETQVMKKIQRQIAKYHQKTKNRALDLQIAQLFQALDMRNLGRLTRKMLKGIIGTHGKYIGNGKAATVGVPESDINAIMRRMDSDGDEELSFSDFFASLLPYFIYGELRTDPTTNQKLEHTQKRTKQMHRQVQKSINSAVRAKSASAAQRRKPPAGQPNFWQKNNLLLKHPDSFIDDCFSQRDDYVEQRSTSAKRDRLPSASYEMSPLDKSPTAPANGLFSQDQPQLYFHKPPANISQIPNLSGRDQRTLAAQLPKSARSNNAEISGMTTEEAKHKLYVQPLMNFFHDCIDFERTIEIGKQELVLQQDYSIYNVFKALAGPGKKFLALCDLQAILAKHFLVRHPYQEMKLAIQRQFPIDMDCRVDQMRYTDYLDLVKPKNPEFAEYVNRKLHESAIGYDEAPNYGMNLETKCKFGKLFDDLVRLENDLEMQRKYKIPQINIKDLYNSMDTEMKGFATLHDYYKFFESSYCENLPVSTEEITLLFKRHDKERQGRVTYSDLLKELMPLDEYLRR